MNGTIRKLPHPVVLRSCPFCQSNEVLTIVDLGTVYYACGGCKRYFTPSEFMRKMAEKPAELRRIEVPVEKRAEIKVEALEKMEDRAVVGIKGVGVNYIAVLQRTEKGYEVQLLSDQKEPLSPRIRYRHLDQLFDRKGKPLRDVVKDRDLFIELAIALQRVGAELTPKAEEEAITTIMEEEPEGPQLEFRGGILENMDLTYEPLGHGLYVWKQGENHGISKMEPIYRQDEKGRTKKTPYQWKIMIDDCELYFKKEPYRIVKSFLETLPFRVPDIAFLEKWVQGNVKAKNSVELFRDVEFYVKVILEVEEAYNAVTLTTHVFQCWLRNILEAMFNIDVAGPPGSGKTTALEAINEVCYHSLLGTASAPALARMNEKYGLSWFLDEYDAQKTWLSDHFVRLGYRKGALVFRINPKTGREEIFRPFGPKMLSYHEELETALKQRSLDHVKLTKSLDHRLPIINRMRETLSKPLFHDLFTWYMENIITFKKKLKEEFPELEEIEALPELPNVTEKTRTSSHILENTHTCVISKNREELPKNMVTSGNSGNREEEIRRFRESFYQKAIEKLSSDEKSFIQGLSDRPCELAFNAVLIGRLLGVDIIEHLKEAIEVKVAEEEEELDYEPIVKEVLADVQDRPEVPQKDVYAEARKRVKEALSMDLSTYKFKAILRDLGFRDKKTIVKTRKGYRKLIFTDSIRGKLPKREIPEGVPQPLWMTIMAKCEECFKHKLLTHYIILEGKKYNLCRECAESK